MQHWRFAKLNGIFVKSYCRMRLFYIAFTAPLLLFATSCLQRTAVIQPPEIDPTAAAAKALKSFDTNSDGKLDEDELAISALSLKLWDANGDGGVTEPEIVERLESFAETKVGLVATASYVSWNRKPLAGAKIAFEPVSFLGDGMQPSSGTTNDSGTADMCVAESLLPHPNVTGIQPGLYKVRITHPEISLPEKYNTNTMLTFECSPIDSLPPPTFELSK